MVSNFVLGLHDAVRGAAFVVRRPRLWIWVIAPAIAALALVVVAVTSSAALLGPLVASLVGFVPGEWAEWVAGIAFTILVAIVSLSLCLSIATVIAGPFNEMLSERIETIVLGHSRDSGSFGDFIVDAAIGAAHAVRRVLAYLVTVALLLLLGLVPVVGTLAALVLGVIVTARFASYDAYDAVWARHRWAYRDKIAGLRERRWRSLGLGAAIAAMVLVPVLNLVALSFGAAGATLALIDEERARATGPGHAKAAGVPAVR